MAGKNSPTLMSELSHTETFPKYSLLCKPYFRTNDCCAWQVERLNYMNFAVSFWLWGMYYMKVATNTRGELWTYTRAAWKWLDALTPVSICGHNSGVVIKSKLRKLVELPCSMLCTIWMGPKTQHISVSLGRNWHQVSSLTFNHEHKP